MEKRIYPCLDIKKSGTRKEQLLIPKEDQPSIITLRKVLGDLSVEDSMQFMQDRIKETSNNSDLLDWLKSQEDN